MSDHKDKIKHLFSQEAIDKVKEMATDIGVCMFCTELTEKPIQSRPMSVSEVDDNANLWFISSSQSNKNDEIKTDSDVQLFFAKNADSHFLSVFGKATIYKDRKIIEEVWKPIDKTWFEDGKDDPDVTVIKVTPEDAYYWDTKDGKMISMLKWAKGAITGDVSDDGGIEGKINL